MAISEVNGASPDFAAEPDSLIRRGGSHIFAFRLITIRCPLIHVLTAGLSWHPGPLSLTDLAEHAEQHPGVLRVELMRRIKRRILILVDEDVSGLT